MNDLRQQLLKVNQFWFEELEQKDWWMKSDELDQNEAVKLYEKLGNESNLKFERRPYESF